MECYSHSQVNSDIIATLNKHFAAFGFEFHPFLVSWYNARVKQVFTLSYRPDTLAVLAISTPSMFENTFLPFLERKLDPANTRDPLDQAVEDKIKEIHNIIPIELRKLQIIYDFELQPNRAPKILMQTAGHISGAAFYYQRSDTPIDTWSEKENIYGVSMHPRYGGWFAFRAVIILENAIAPDLLLSKPIDCVKAPERRVELLDRFNKHWQDWTYRDMTDNAERYSEEQRLYFGTIPGERGAVVEKLLLRRKELK